MAQQVVERDNRWVVPYNAYLLKRYECHINVEVCTSVQAVKYVFKYIYKGSDRAHVAIQGESVDEIKQYLDCLYVSTSEAAWRLFAFSVCHQWPAVESLDVHLPQQQMVHYQENQPLSHAVATGNLRRTRLLAWFEFNRKQRGQYADALRQDPRTPVPRALETCYSDIHTVARWDGGSREWKLRKRHSETIGRMFRVPPKDRERYYLRLLLQHVPGATCWGDLRTVRDDEGRTHMYDTFEEACRQRGLLRDDRQWEMAMEEAKVAESPARMRQIFAQLLLYNQVDDPQALWDTFKVDMSEDFAYRGEGAFGTDDQGRTWSWEAVMHLQRLLEEGNRDLEHFRIPRPPASVARNKVQEELWMNRMFDYSDLQTNLDKLNRGQQQAYDAIMAAVEAAWDGGPAHQNLFFLDGVGGSGKTFLYKCLLAAVRARGGIALAMASNGLPALLLPNATTAHRRFALPVTGMVTPDVSCGIDKHSDKAEILRQAKVIVWDEAPAMHRYMFEAVDRCLRDICDQPDKPMGGKVVVLGGDFRQCLPVVRHGSRPDYVAASLSRARFWPQVQILKLHENMRVANYRQEGDEGLAQVLEEWSTLLKDIGDGVAPLKAEEPWQGLLPVPDAVAFAADSEDAFLEHIYGGYRSADDKDRFLKESAILAPTNQVADTINQKMLHGDILGRDMRDRPIHTYTSVDVVEDEEQRADFPEEFLNGLEASGLPPHVIRLKVGTPIIALRYITEGVCNGTRLIVTKLMKNSIRPRSSTARTVARRWPSPRSISPTTWTPSTWCATSCPSAWRLP